MFRRIPMISFGKVLNPDIPLAWSFYMRCPNRFFDIYA
jgi:hypothetical protein